MKFLKKFSFWLPFFSFLLIIFEVVVQPVKHIWMAIDPVYVFFYSLLPDGLQHLVVAFILHFAFAVLYGLILDWIIIKFKTRPTVS